VKENRNRPGNTKTMAATTQNRKYPRADVAILYGQAKAMCAFQECRKVLVLEQYEGEKRKQIGKIAHIIAHSPQGPRFDPLYPQEKLDTYENWILLCPTCHDTVDALASKYSVEQLRKIKNAHEKWVAATLAKEMPKITFAELEMATSGICVMSTPKPSDFSVIPPQEKMNRNGLTEKTNSLFSIGLCMRNEVRNFIQHVAIIDSSFPDRLKEGFLNEYQNLRSENFYGDSLFESMREFASNGKTDFAKQAAGLAVLTYLFETCEVFEK
jgi:hypothetical protein